MAIPLGAAMLGSAAITTVGGLLGGGQQQQQQPQDLTPLYLAAAPINQRLTYKGQEFVSSWAPYLTAIQGQTQLGLGMKESDYAEGLSRAAQQAGLLTGGAAGYMTAAIDKDRFAGMAGPALELKGGETATDMRSKAADVLGLQYTSAAKGLQDLYGSSASTRNQMLAQQQLGNIQANQRASEIKNLTEAELTKRRQATATALTPRFA